LSSKQKEKRIWFQSIPWYPCITGQSFVSAFMQKWGEHKKYSFEPSPFFNMNSCRYRTCVCCYSDKLYKVVRWKTGWLSISLMCPSRAACLPMDGLMFQWRSTIKNQTKRVGLVQITHHHFLSPQFNFFRHDRAEKLLT
jgi:hypothetical protein